jgi:hypothetical protein
MDMLLKSLTIQSDVDDAAEVDGKQGVLLLLLLVMAKGVKAELLATDARYKDNRSLIFIYI